MRTPPVAEGDRIDVIVDTLIAGGDALCRLEGFPIFVPGLVPGDVATIDVVELRKGFARGETVELRSPSPDRRAAPCPVAGECGGCDWTNLRLDRQLEAKRHILTDSLRRTGRLPAASIPPIRLHPSPLNYRLRSRLHRDPDTGAIGFFGRRSHDVVPLPDDCEIVGTRTLSGLAEIREQQWLRDTIDVFEADDGLVVVERHESEVSEEEVRIEAGGWQFQLSTGSFFQVNRHLLPRLIELVKRIASATEGKQLAFDLYGGVGFFSVPLSECFEEVVLVESMAESARYAVINLVSRSGVRVVTRSVEAFLASVRTRPDFVLVDPPRAGMSPRVRRELQRIGPKEIAYLSCDPVTFARDVAELVGHGWTIRTLDLVDLFPNTHHVETLASLVIAD